jgi:DinB superfamily
MTIEPDTKDWTWVLERRCSECGFVASLFPVTELPALIEANTAGWAEALRRVDTAVRPAANVWSPLEYACHVRDVHLIFGERLRLMLEEDDPEFEDWDQDAAALEDAYDKQHPATVGIELADAATAVARRYAKVTGDQWARRGRRSNGSEFTVESLGRYYFHDIVHHLYDVGRR